MVKTAGASTFQFSLRIIGTLIAMTASYIIWYIVDGKAAGVIVFLFLWMCVGYYAVLKMPKAPVIGVLSIVTSVLIVAYELQVQKIGKAVSQSNGQPAYPLVRD